MSNQLQTFNFNLNQVRIQIINNKEYFCAKDVCDVLGYQNSTKAIQDNCKKDGVTTSEVIDALGRIQNANFLSEPNLLRLIVKSKLPEAEKFEAWVFEEILPQIRKTGKFEVAPQIQLPQDYIEALEYLVRAEKEKKALENTVQKQTQEIQVLGYEKEVVEKNLEFKEAEVKEKEQVIEKMETLFKQVADKTGCVKFQACARSLGITDNTLRTLLIGNKWRHKSKAMATTNGVDNGFVKMLPVEYTVALPDGKERKDKKLTLHITAKGYEKLLQQVGKVGK